MTKAFDQAQELEGIERESLIAAQRKALVRVTYSHCEDCGE